jgi:glycerol-3-phosphate acyltransferase PlsY
MNLMIALLAALVGYLLGSISFARLVVKLVAPGKQLDGFRMDVSDAKEPVDVEAFSGTAVAMMLGDKYGGITALLDILKAALPTLAFRLIYPGQTYHLVVATMAVVGHNWPLYYRFKGGRGLSPMIGGFLVVDWLGTLVTSLVALALGIAVKSVLLAYMGGTWLMIPWLWIRSQVQSDGQSLAYVIYAVVVNLLMSLAMVPDVRNMIDSRRRGVSGSFAASMEVIPMGRGIKRLAGWFGLMQDEPAPEQNT